MRTRKKDAFTLLEMTIVIGVLLALIGTGLMGSNAVRDWRLGREASETLRTVYAAQRMYLADNPTAAVSTITSAALIPYLPNKATVMPTVKSLTGSTLSMKVDVSPPVVNNGSGSFYDPSKTRTDNLWDVGE